MLIHPCIDLLNRYLLSAYPVLGTGRCIASQGSHTVSGCSEFTAWLERVVIEEEHNRGRETQARWGWWGGAPREAFLGKQTPRGCQGGDELEEDITGRGDDRRGVMETREQGWSWGNC